MGETSRRQWKRLALPEELMDLLVIIAKSQGRDENKLHLFLYHMLKTCHPEEVEKLSDILGTTWLDSNDQP